MCVFFYVGRRRFSGICRVISSGPVVCSARDLSRRLYSRRRVLVPCATFYERDISLSTHTHTQLFSGGRGVGCSPVSLAKPSFPVVPSFDCLDDFIALTRQIIKVGAVCVYGCTRMFRHYLAVQAAAACSESSRESRWSFVVFVFLLVFLVSFFFFSFGPISTAPRLLAGGRGGRRKQVETYRCFSSGGLAAQAYIFGDQR